MVQSPNQLCKYMYSTSTRSASNWNLKHRSLHFFCVNRGKIFSSRRREAYTTFQELGRNKKLVVDQQQQSDQWLVDKLHEHYFLIKRRYQGLLWELLHLRTIGFATFLRVCFRHNVLALFDQKLFLKILSVRAHSAAGSQWFCSHRKSPSHICARRSHFPVQILAIVPIRICQDDAIQFGSTCRQHRGEKR